MVTNQDGLGTPSLSARALRARAATSCCELFASQGIEFDAVFICPHFTREGCGCRKPRTGLVQRVPARSIRSIAARSCMIGDRDTDLEFAAQSRASAACASRSDGAAQRELAGDRASACCAPPPRAGAAQDHARPTSRSRSTSTREAPSRIEHRHRLLRSHARAARQARRLRARARAAAAICTSTSTTPSRTARWRSARRCAQALGDKRGIGRYGFLLPMDEAEAQVALDLSGRPYFVFEGRFDRERVGDAADRAGAAFLPLAGRQRWARRCTQRARREHPPHGRGLLQGRRPRAAPGDAPRRRRAAEHQGRAVSDARRRRSSTAAAPTSPRCSSRSSAWARAASCQRDAGGIAAAPHVHPAGRRRGRRRHGAAARAAALDRLIPALHAAGARHLPRHAAAVRGSDRGRHAHCLGVLPGRVDALHRRARAARCRTWAGTRSRSQRD